MNTKQHGDKTLPMHTVFHVTVALELYFTVRPNHKFGGSHFSRYTVQFARQYVQVVENAEDMIDMQEEIPAMPIRFVRFTNIVMVPMIDRTWIPKINFSAPTFDELPPRRWTMSWETFYDRIQSDMTPTSVLPKFIASTDRPAAGVQAVGNHKVFANEQSMVWPQEDSRDTLSDTQRVPA